MRSDRGSSSQRANADVAGNEGNSPRAAGQIQDSPASHLRNVLQILELAQEWTRHGHGPQADDGHIFLKRQEAADVRNLVGLAIALSDKPVAPDDPTQLMIADFRPQALPDLLDLSGRD